MKLALLFCAAFVCTTAKPEKTDKSIFDDDSDFMKGFETGIMMRSKQGQVEDFGCVVPEDKHEYKFIFD